MILHSSLFTSKVKPFKSDKKWQKLSIMPHSFYAVPIPNGTLTFDV